MSKTDEQQQRKEKKLKLAPSKCNEYGLKVETKSRFANERTHLGSFWPFVCDVKKKKLGRSFCAKIDIKRKRHVIVK